MKPQVPFISSFCLAIAILGQGFFAKSQEMPTGVVIERAEAIGSGCKPNSVSTTISPDFKELSLLFDDFVTEAGGNGKPEQERKLCNISIVLRIPETHQLGLLRADYRGFAGLEDGAQGQHEVLYSLNRSQSGSFSSKVFTGPMSDEYFISNQIDPKLINWSTCGAKQVLLMVRVNLVSQVLRMVNGKRPSAQMTLDSFDTALEQNFELGWRNCKDIPKPPPPNRPPGFNPPNAELTVMYQMFDGRTRYFTHDPRLLERAPWVNQGAVFRAYAQQMREFQAAGLFQCLSANQRYFVSTDSRCEGQRTEKLLGYVSINPLNGTFPLYEMVNGGDSFDRAVTLNPAQYPGYRQTRILGYVMPPRRL